MVNENDLTSEQSVRFRVFPRVSAVLLGVALEMLASALGAQAQETGRPITITDYTRIRSLSSLQPSPDGRSALLRIGTVDTAKDESTSDLWMLDLTSGALRQVTNNPGSEWNERFSPDGLTLAYLATRDERSQVLGLPLDGGEARPLFTFTGGVDEFAWFPDGKRIVFVARDPVLAPVEPRRPDTRVYTRTYFKVNGEGFVDTRPAQLWVADLPTGTVTRITDGDFDHGSPAVSPDGRFVAFVSNRTSDRDENRNTDVWLIPVAGESVTRVSVGAGMAAEPRWSPDGRFLAYLEQTVANNYGSHSYVWVAAVGQSGQSEPAVGTPRNLTASLDMSVGEGSYQEGGAPYPIWSRDGRMLYVSFETRGRLHGYALDASTGRATLLHGGDQMTEYLTPLGDGRLLFGLSDGTHLSDIYLSPPGGASPRRLTTLNPWVDSVRVSPPERFVFRSGDGEPVEGFVVKPPGFTQGRKYPSVLVIHGGPQWYYSTGFEFFFQVLAAKGYLVVYTNPRGSTTYGTRFLDLIGDRYGHADYQDFMAAMDTVIGRGWADPGNLFVAGSSYGGMSTMWIITQTSRFRAAAPATGVSDYSASFGEDDDHLEWIASMGGTPWQVPEKYRAYSPMTFITSVRTPTVFLHGSNDWICPTVESERMYLALKLLGVETKLVIFPGENHNFDAKASGYPERWRQAMEWFDGHRGN